MSFSMEFLGFDLVWMSKRRYCCFFQLSLFQDLVIKYCFFISWDTSWTKHVVFPFFSYITKECSLASKSSRWLLNGNTCYMYESSFLTLWNGEVTTSLLFYFRNIQNDRARKLKVVIFKSHTLSTRKIAACPKTAKTLGKTMIELKN